MKIGTHNGVFHADDVFAVAVLLLLYPEAKVIRSRDPKVLETCDVVVDVGGVYDVAEGRFDHHQKGRAGQSKNGIFYSSFGLVWLVFGTDVVCLTCGETNSETCDYVMNSLVQPIDATDNGQSLFEGGKPVFEDVSPVSLSAVIAGFNPTWNDTDKDFDSAFMRAVEFAKAIIVNEIRNAFGVVKAQDIVAEALVQSMGKDGDSRLVVLDRFCPWAEQVRDQAPEALFCVFPSETGTWMVQAVNKTAGTFESRKLLPEAWAGLRDQAFREATGVHDGVFCHPGRFICGADSKESALKLAQLAISS